MSLDKTIINSIKKNLEEKGQSPDLIKLILDWCERKDGAKILVEEKTNLIERILEEIKIEHDT
jgi:50S ribosomal subunit-associated GTPase HflX